MQRIENAADLERFVGQPAALLYFGSPGCGVCQALKPRVAGLVAEEFPQLPLAEIDCEASPMLAAQHQVFAIPTVLAFFDGRETLRKARAFSVGELAEGLARPYAMLFE